MKCKEWCKSSSLCKGPERRQVAEVLQGHGLTIPEFLCMVVGLPTDPAHLATAASLD